MQATTARRGLGFGREALMVVALVLAVYILGGLSGYVAKTITIPAAVSVGASSSGSTAGNNHRPSGSQLDDDNAHVAPNIEGFQP